MTLQRFFRPGVVLQYLAKHPAMATCDKRVKNFDKMQFARNRELLLVEMCLTYNTGIPAKWELVESCDNVRRDGSVEIVLASDTCWSILESFFNKDGMSLKARVDFCR